MADALSRSSIQSIDSVNPTFELIADELRKDATLDKLNDTSLQLKEHPVPFGTKTILCDVKTGHSRPYIPPSLRKRLFPRFHNLSHPGHRATTKLMSNRFVWPNMNTDIKKTGLKPAWIVRRAKQTDTQSLLQDNSKDQMVGSQTYTSILSDHCQQYMTINLYLPWLTGLQDGLKYIPAETISKNILREWIAVFGCPSVIITDRGSQFQSTLFDEFTKLLGVKHIKTTAYPPYANRLIERFHRQLKTALTANTPEHG